MIAVLDHIGILACSNALLQTPSHSPLLLLEASLLPFHTLLSPLILVQRPMFWSLCLNIFLTLSLSTLALGCMFLSIFCIFLGIATPRRAFPVPDQEEVTGEEF